MEPVTVQEINSILTENEVKASGENIYFNQKR